MFIRTLFKGNNNHNHNRGSNNHNRDNNNQDNINMLTNKMMNPKPLTLINHPICDDYEITDKTLGLGINGKVVECYHKQSGAKFAVKVRTVNCHFFLNCFDYKIQSPPTDMRHANYDFFPSINYTCTNLINYSLLEGC